MDWKIADDKKKHFVVGIPLGLLLQLLSSIFLIAYPVAATILGFLALTAICYAFELVSLLSGKGHADNMDAIAGILGGAIGIALYWGVYAVA